MLLYDYTILITILSPERASTPLLASPGAPGLPALEPKWLWGGGGGRVRGDQLGETRQLKARPNAPLANLLLRGHQCGINNSLDMVHPHIIFKYHDLQRWQLLQCLLQPHSTRDPFGLA